MVQIEIRLTDETCGTCGVLLLWGMYHYPHETMEGYAWDVCLR